METKLFEIRDRATFIPVLAVRLGSDDEAERYLAGRAGYGTTIECQRDYVFLAKLDGDCEGGTYDPNEWLAGRTIHDAHKYIIDNWDDLHPGAVIDVEFIAGESAEPKQSERFYCPTELDWAIGANHVE